MSCTVADRLSTADVLDTLAQARRLRVLAEARETEMLALLAADPDPYRDGSGELGKDWIVEDVAAVLRVPSTVAAAKLHTAHRLATHFPATLTALQSWRLELRHATRLVELTDGLPEAVLPALEAEALHDVETRTVTQFAARVRRLVAKADSRGNDELHRCARDERRVLFTPAPYGMTELYALLPAEDAAALQSTLQRMAGADRGDDRTADQRRADALRDLACGGDGLRPQVQVVVNVSTLLGLDDQPGELDGYGPVTAAAARALAADPSGTWRRLLTDPAGNLIDVASRTYRPPASMQRLVALRDRTCRFPTCRRRAGSCELDHVVPWSVGGPTRAGNLIALCPRHHHLKHDGGWRVRREPDGTVMWTSPTGRVHRSPPPEPVLPAVQTESAPR